MRAYLLIICVLTFGCTSGQDREEATPKLLGSCQGCEAVFEFEDRELLPVDTLDGFKDQLPTLYISGKILNEEGSPASDIILYLYHTDESGVYPVKGGETGWARRHGYRRGWVKSAADGSYGFYTNMPGVYPERTEPAHVHITILEPDGSYYWIDSYLFDGDPLISSEIRNKKNPRGGKGILTIENKADVLTADRDIILRLNIPDSQ